MSISYNKAFTRVDGPGHVPSGVHYTIIIFDRTSITIPGDERSRTNPGHGYPERTETYNTYQYYITRDKSEWEKALKELHVERKSFVGLVSSKAIIQEQVVVDVKLQ